VGVDPRPLVGGPLRRGHTRLTDVDPFNPVAEMDLPDDLVPLLMTDPDGTRWGLFMHLIEASGFGHQRRTVIGAVEHGDGRVERMADIRPDLAFDPDNRRLLGRPGVGHPGGRLGALVPAGGPHRPPGSTSGPACTSAGKATTNGEWRGELHVDGERIDDCRLPEVARQLHQLRDTFVVVRDLDSGAVGHGNCQPMVTGAHPSLGLAADTSFW